MQIKQKYLGNIGFFILLVFLSAFIPLSTDLYLPALPSMAKYFNTSAQLINLTLISFFIFFSFGMLFWGPLSDKYGRKIILIIGIIIYIIGSVLCAIASNVYYLIIFRIIQAIGGSAASSISMALVKDVYTGKKRESVLAIVQSMVMISPAIAPVFGAFLLKFTSWRGMFWALTCIGILVLVGGILLKETIDKRNSGTIFQVFKRLGFVLKNKGFTSLLLLFSLQGISMMAFIASSSYIYIDGFHQNEQTYSFYFSLNAIALILGPMLYMYLSKFLKRNIIIFTCLFLTALSGLLVCIIGSINPILFAISMLFVSITGSCLRPPSANLMLEQQNEDTGSASSLISFWGLLMGCFGMFIISFNWENTIFTLGIINFIIGILSTIIWLIIFNRPFIKQVPDYCITPDKKI